MTYSISNGGVTSPGWNAQPHLLRRRGAFVTKPPVRQVQEHGQARRVMRAALRVRQARAQRRAQRRVQPIRVASPSLVCVVAAARRAVAMSRGAGTC